jgi:cytochrome c-type biogenesis protein CcmI
MITLIQILLVVAVAAIVLYPLLRYRGQQAYRETRFEAKQRSVAERKERLYGTIVDLDFDRDAGKISAEDHARMRDEAMREVLAVLAEEDALLARAPVPIGGRIPPAPPAVPGGDSVERLIEEYKRKRAQSVEATQA